MPGPKKSEADLQYVKGARTTDLLCYLFFKTSGELRIWSLEEANQIRLQEYLLRGAYYPLLAERKAENGRINIGVLSEEEHAQLGRRRKNWNRFLIHPESFTWLLTYFSGQTTTNETLTLIRRYLHPEENTHLFSSKPMVTTFEDTSIGQLLDSPFLGTKAYPKTAIQNLVRISASLETTIPYSRSKTIRQFQSLNRRLNNVKDPPLKPKSVWLKIYDQTLVSQLRLLKSTALSDRSPVQALHRVLCLGLDKLLGREVVQAICHLTFGKKKETFEALYDHTLYFLLQLVSLGSNGKAMSPTLDPGFFCVRTIDRTKAAKVFRSMLSETGNLNAYDLLPEAKRELLEMADLYLQTGPLLQESATALGTISSEQTDPRWIYKRYRDVTAGVFTNTLERETQWLLWTERATQRLQKDEMTNPEAVLTLFLEGLSEIARGRVPVHTSGALPKDVDALLELLYDRRVTMQLPEENLYLQVRQLLQTAATEDRRDRATVLAREFFRLLESGWPEAASSLHLLSVPGVAGPKSDPLPLPPQPELSEDIEDISVADLLDLWDRRLPTDRPTVIRAEQALILGYLDGELLDDLLGLERASGKQAVSPSVVSAEMSDEDRKDGEGGERAASLPAPIFNRLVCFTSIKTFESERTFLQDLRLNLDGNTLEINVTTLPQLTFLYPGSRCWLRVLPGAGLDLQDRAVLVTLLWVTNATLTVHCEDSYLREVGALTSDQVSMLWLTHAYEDPFLN
ncbi:hypothetical protein MF271_00680 (plasmid) [Deinococcus sp. KNUC1210]|uniref:hypothetical protein n=1 Tax=Deinococcus sp. KNUC1210 TaxID=2917691 RepID=UPI001EF070E5|nr:hypothetical protein [Deinococcus sp. KNUC1210]ULH14028.1 hypothetical protein MF271_00680 [Deinococcus sp. KNUC1210]